MAITYATVQSALSKFMGYRSDVTSLSVEQIAELDSIIQSGYRRFLYPSGLSADLAGYQWSFMRGVTSPSTWATGNSPYGSPECDEILFSSVMAVAEELLYSQQGPQYNKYMELLQSAIARDKLLNSPVSGGSSSTYSGLKEMVGSYLGYGSSSSKWTEDQTDAIEAIVESGYQQFIMPPLLNGVPAGFRWSFVDINEPVGSASTATINTDYYDVYRSSVMAVAEHAKIGQRGDYWKAFNDRLAAATIRDKRENVVQVSSGTDYLGLCRVAASYLGWGVADSSWSDSQRETLDAIVQSAVRQYLFPPMVEGMANVHSWSFLNPTGTIDTVASTYSYDLPSDFNRFTGSLTFPEENYVPVIKVISEGSIRQKLTTGTTGRPLYAATVFEKPDGENQAVQKLLLYPIPETVYTIEYKYECYAGIINDENYRVPGGESYAELLIASVLAVAESRIKNKREGQWDNFVRTLFSAVSRDRKNGVKLYGNMGNRNVESECRSRFSNIITYNGEAF